jgi:tripartite motif-containing protein 71
MMDLNCVKILLIFVLVGSVMLGSVFTSNNTYAALKDPIGVAVDPSNGNVFITANTIQKFSNDGKFIREWGSGYSIAVDKSGNVFVTTNNLTGNYDHVEKYTNTGKFIRKWGSTGTDKGQFDKPGDITVDSKGYVFVADTGMDRIQKFSNTGKFIREWGHVRGGGGNITATSSSLSPSPSPSISSVPMDMETGAPLALQ